MFLKKHASLADNVFIAILGLITCSIVVLNSLAPELFPQYYFFVFMAVSLYLLLKRIDFEIFSSFSAPVYIFGILLLVATLIIGSVTRGTVRWIPIGNFAFQPSEVVRPFLFLYFASVLSQMTGEISEYLKLGVIAAVPLLLIFIQPSFGVTIITLAGFFGMILVKGISKKIFLVSIIVFLAGGIVSFLLLKPYQKDRILSFLNPQLDPGGAGYNSIQSVIAVGSGNLFGKGLGHGIQTQLRFLPEKQTDFIFAGIAEEIGFVGALFVMLLTFFILYKLIRSSEGETNETKELYIVGCIFTYLSQVFIHVGMNLGVLPITGVPFPLVSAGGSSLIGTIVMLAIAFSA